MKRFNRKCVWGMFLSVIVSNVVLVFAGAAVSNGWYGGFVEKLLMLCFLVVDLPSIALVGVPFFSDLGTLAFFVLLSGLFWAVLAGFLFRFKAERVRVVSVQEK